MNYFKVYLTCIMMLCLATAPTWAAVWRVNNTDGVNADFTTLQDAHDAASSGDTIYVEGSENYYAGPTITKQLTIIGPGYFLAENPETQANLSDANVSGWTTFDTGSSGSLITGMHLVSTLYIVTNSIVVKRNQLNNVNIGSSDNSIITQNWISSGGANIDAIVISGHSNNHIIANNIIFHSYSGLGAHCINMSISASATIENNVISSLSNGNINIYNSTFQNNILMGGSSTGSNCVIRNNLCDGTQLASGNDNQLNVDMSTVFMYTGSTDGQYQLKAGSPALGAGYTGQDCGAFGGVTPYILSGIPHIPAIYDFGAPATGNQSTGLPVYIKAKSHN